MESVAKRRPNKFRHHFKPGEVARWLGVSEKTIQNMFDAGELGGYRTLRGSDRRISRPTLVQYAMKCKIQIPEIGMYPFSIVMLGVHNAIADAVHRAAVLTNAVVKRAASEAEFGLMIADGETCSGVVDTSIGTSAACELGKMVRRHPKTRNMLLIAIAAEDVPPLRIAQSGYDTVYRQPFVVTTLVKRLTKAAREFQEQS